MDGISPELRAYMQSIGQRGGRKSRRKLDAEQARAMVRVREARKLYARFYSRCFWSAPPNWKPGLEDIEWVAANLRKHGGREGWEAASKLCL